MSTIFLRLVNLSISASWLVLAVLVLRLVLKRAPKWVNVLLWGMVALRLLLPFSIETALSLIPSAETISPGVVQYDPAPAITSGVPIIDDVVNPIIQESFAAEPFASVNPLYVWTEIAGIVWIIGLAAMLLYALVSFMRLRRRVSASLRLQENIYLCDAISSPFILGIVQPRIFLPSELDEVQQQNVLAHERAHISRHDHWWKPLGFALLAIYWFNPLLWLAYVLLCRDIELACDEHVIRDMDEKAVASYSTVLLACSVPRRMVVACPLAFGEVGVKARVKNALHYKKPAFWIVAASVIVCAAVAVCFLTNPRRTLGEVCGDFWDNAAVCSYMEERSMGANAQYPEKTLRLCDFLSGVRIGTARAEKKVAINPDWSTLYLALPGEDGTPVQHLTIDFVREHDTLVSSEAIYSLNIGTRTSSKSYEVLSGQEEIDAFLAYLRNDLPDAHSFIQWCSRFRGENVTNISISVDSATAMGYTGETLKILAAELEPRLRALTEEQQVQPPDTGDLRIDHSSICLMIGDNEEEYMIDLSADGNSANTIHVLGALRADKEGKYFRSKAYYDAPGLAAWIRSKAIPLLEGDLPEAETMLPLGEDTYEDDAGLAHAVKTYRGEFPGGTRLTVGTFELTEGKVTFSGAWSPSYASVCAIAKPNGGGGDGAVIYFKSGDSCYIEFGKSGSYDIVLLAPEWGIDGTVSVDMH